MWMRAPLAGTAYSPAKAPPASKKKSPSTRIRSYYSDAFWAPSVHCICSLAQRSQSAIVKANSTFGMPFHIQPFREFLVRPSLPDSLSRLTELAYNIVWSWEPLIRSVFRRLDPTIWRESGYNPVLMLGRVSQATLQRASTDPRYLALYRAACATYDARVRKSPPPADGRLIAYFSAEYGLTECLPAYSGGLRILSGD